MPKKKNTGIPYNKQDLTGQRFGRLVAIERAGLDKWGLMKWIVKCDCGTVKTVHARNLISGRTLSCNCLQKDFVGKLKYSHGFSGDIEYSIFRNMIDRCENPKNESYVHYGAIGIRVSEEFHDYSTWLEHIGRRPSADYSLDRISVFGHYERGNIRWTTREQQQRNKRDTKYYEYNGESHCLMDWAEILGFDYGLVHGRIWKGWDFKKAVETPAREKRPNGQAKPRYIPVRLRNQEEPQVSK